MAVSWTVDSSNNFTGMLKSVIEIWGYELTTMFASAITIATLLSALSLANAGVNFLAIGDW